MHRDISSDPDQLERFRREARAVAQLNHPHVVTVIDAGEDDGAPVHRLRVRRGRDAQGAHPPPRPAAGRRGGRLRDRDRPRARVRPRAQARPPRREAPERPDRPRRPRQGHRLRHRALARGAGPHRHRPRARHHRLRLARAGARPRGDRAVRHLLARDRASTRCSPARRPFKADTQVAVAMKHVRDPLPDVQRRRPEISAALAAVVERATAKETQNRYATVDEMVHDLEQVLAIEAARSGQATGEATTVLRSLPGDTADFAPQRLRHPRRTLFVSVAAARDRRRRDRVPRHAHREGPRPTRPPRAAPACRDGRARRRTPPTTTTPRATARSRAARCSSRSTASRRTVWDTETYEGGFEGSQQVRASACTSNAGSRVRRPPAGRDHLHAGLQGGRLRRRQRAQPASRTGTRSAARSHVKREQGSSSTRPGRASATTCSGSRSCPRAGKVDDQGARALQSELSSR